ncbi:hypothetical protein C8E97_2326 [Saccharothrix australiensis]|uniref:Uncharacterized protein n=1 Tax=Saccharothrix australiensis TaxID=2072 RepID=A0A495VYD4_9PSEU|nr:hypothetical protein C8E97_2326 [Saccharothrix australiensis]
MSVTIIASPCAAVVPASCGQPRGAEPNPDAAPPTEVPVEHARRAGAVLEPTQGRRS